MDFNKKISNKILLDLQDAKKNNISIKRLEDKINQNLMAVDSTFPKQIILLIEGILSKIKIHKQEQYASTLNTSEEGTYNENLPVGNLFDQEIIHLKRYINNKNDKIY